MKVKDLSKFKDNPRVISAEQKRILKKGLDKYGDLGGVVFNLELNELVGGNQRSDTFDPDDEIVYFEKLKAPDNQGTVAHGYIVHDGKKYNYREVRWSREDHVAASLLANKGGGEWDWSKAKQLILSVDTGAFDLEFTGFPLLEIENMMTASTMSAALDYSALDGANMDDKISLMADGVRKAIQIEFQPEDYEEAQALVKYWREQGAYIGKMLIDTLKHAKAQHEESKYQL